MSTTAPGERQVDSSENQDGREDEPQRYGFGEEQDAADGRQHRNRKLNHGGAGRVETSQRLVPEDIADAGRQRSGRDAERRPGRRDVELPSVDQADRQDQRQRADE